MITADGEMRLGDAPEPQRSPCNKLFDTDHKRISRE